MSVNQSQTVEVESEGSVEVEVEQSQTLAERTIDASVNLFVGLPGAGKSKGCEIAEEIIGDDETVSSHEISDYVKYEYAAITDDVASEVDDNELGRWADDMKTMKGMGHFAEGLAHQLRSPIPEASNINVAGVRSPAEADAFRDVFDDVTIISVWTLPDIRYDRLADREGEYTTEEFSERKKRELWDWDCIEFFTNENYYDYIIPNNHTKEAFRSSLELALRGTKAYTDEPFPVGLDQEQVGQYL